MKLSNLRIERNNKFSYLTIDVTCDFTSNSRLWISVPSEYEEWLSDDVYDAFLLATIYPAMYYGENIEIAGNVSPRLLFNMRNYICHAIKAYREDMNMIDISVGGTSIPMQNSHHVATGFSGGIDAFTTVIDRLENETDALARIDTFIFHNIGSHGGVEREQENYSIIDTTY